MYKNNVEIVVARYNENLDWLNSYPFDQFEYIVYNKGDNENFEKNNVKTVINIPNVGRCDHTYLYHIIQNYYNLSNIVVFFPGSLNLPNKMRIAKTILENIMKSSYSSAYFIGSYCKSLKIQFKDFYLDSWCATSSENNSKNNEHALTKCKIRPYGRWYSYFFGNLPGHWVTFGGIFSIDKRDIIQHSINRYITLIQTVNTSSNPEAGHYIERSWGAIFFPLNFTDKIKI